MQYEWRATEVTLTPKRYINNLLLLYMIYRCLIQLSVEGRSAA